MSNCRSQEPQKKISESFGPTDPLNNQKIRKGLSVFWQIEKVSTWGVHTSCWGNPNPPYEGPDNIGMWRHVELLLQGMLDACHRESKGKMDLLRFAEWILTPPASNKPHTSPSCPCFGSLVCLPLVYNIIRTQGPSHESSQAGWWAPSRFTFVWGPLYMKVFFIGTTLKSEVGHPTICWTWLETSDMNILKIDEQLKTRNISDSTMSIYIYEYYRWLFERDIYHGLP